MRNLILALFVLYLGIAPIYWLPGVSPGLLNWGKLAIIALAVVCVWGFAISRAQLKFPPGILGPLGIFLMMVVSAGGFLLAFSNAELLLRTKDYLLSFVTIWTFYMMALCNMNAHRAFVLGSLVIAAFSAVVVISGVFRVPNWSGPAHFHADYLWISGFGATRTGWSNGVALFTPILASALFMDGRYRRSMIVKLILIGAIAAILGSQFVTAGRAGILATVLGVGYVLLMRGGRGYLLLGGVAALVMVALNLETFLIQMRIIADPDVATSGNVLNDISSGRVYGAMIALERAMESPLIGHGFGNVTLKGTEIHNLWLKLFVEAGLLLPLLLAYLVFRVFRIDLKKRAYLKRDAGTSYEHRYRFASLRAYEAILLMGLLMSMLEPRALLGSYQLSVLWWCVIGSIAGMKIQSVQRGPQTRPLAAGQPGAA